MPRQIPLFDRGLPLGRWADLPETVRAEIVTIYARAAARAIAHRWKEKAHDAERKDSK
jgi:hypothetical protein